MVFPAVGGIKFPVGCKSLAGYKSRAYAKVVNFYIFAGAQSAGGLTPVSSNS
jgi:hypothetical protein